MYIDSALFADDQVLLAKSEDELQYNVMKLHQVLQSYDVKISADKTKSMAMEVKIKGKVIPLHAMEAHGGERRYSCYSFLTSAIDGGEWSASRPGQALPPGKEPPVPIG
jgi:hypothetical protein